MQRLSLTRSQLETPAALGLLQLLHSIIADGKLTDAEIATLFEWLRQHANADLPAIAYLTTVVQSVVADGKITPEERAWVQKAVETVLPLADREEAAVRRREGASAERMEAAQATEAQREVQREEARLARPLRHFDVMVAGAYYENRQAAIAGIAEGEQITLAREIGNPYSSNAILLLRQNGRNIGYVPEIDAVEMAPLIDVGAKHDADVKKILHGHGGPIPVIWGVLYQAQSREGQASPRINFGQTHKPEAPRATPHPSRKSSCGAWFAVAFIGLLLVGLIYFAASH